MGEVFRERMRQIASPLIREVRGRGLMNALVIKPTSLGEVGQSVHMCALTAGCTLLNGALLDADIAVCFYACGADCVGRVPATEGERSACQAVTR